MELMNLVSVKKYLLLLSIATLFMACEASSSKSKSFLTVDNIINDIESISPKSEEYKTSAEAIIQNSKQIGYNKGLVHGYCALARYKFYNKEFVESYEINRKALDIARDTESDSLTGFAYYRLAHSFEFIKQYDSAYTAYNKSLYFLSEAKDTLHLQSAQNMLGLYYWRLGLLDSAVYHFENSMDLRRRLDDINLLAASLNNLGTVYYQWALYDSALDYYFQSLKIREENNYYHGASIVSTNIGMVYVKVNDYLNAKKYFNQAFKYARKENSVTATAYVVGELGSLYISENKYDSAKTYLENSLKIFEADKDTFGIQFALGKLGDIYMKMEEYNKAEEKYLQSLEVAKARNIKLRLAANYYLLGELNYKLNKFKKAEDYLLKSIELGEKLGKLDLLSDSYNIMRLMYSKRGNPVKALEYFEKYDKYKIELSNNDLNRRAQGLEAKYELAVYQNKLRAEQLENEKKYTFLFFTFFIIIILIFSSVILVRLFMKSQKNNSLLKNKNNLINEQKIILEKTNQTKEKLFSILAHDVKNPFQAINGYTEMMLTDYDILTEEEKKTYLNEISLTSYKLTDLLENMLNWSASQTGALKLRKVEVDLAEIINSVIELTNSQASRKKIKIVAKMDKLFYVKTDKFVFQVVLRNLITNAIKYSYENSVIEVAVNEQDDKLIVSVSDTGTGMPNDATNTLFENNEQMTLVGTNGEKGTGLGLMICKEFVERSGGKIWVESNEGKGSKFSFTLFKN